MKILVAYYSETGNTAKVAQKMYDELSKDQKVDLMAVQDVSVDTLTSYHLVFLGGPVHDSDLAKTSKHLLESLPINPGLKLAGFSTHSVYVPDGTPKREELYKRWAGECLHSFESICREKGVSFLGYFHCQGAASPPIEEFIHREIITSGKEWKEYLPELQKHPNSEDLKNAKNFARDLIRKY
ncbi:MAG: flavodoxin family protein [Promethearchaeota archaeon]